MEDGSALFQKGSHLGDGLDQDGELGAVSPLSVT